MMHKSRGILLSICLLFSTYATAKLTAPQKAQAIKDVKAMIGDPITNEKAIRKLIAQIYDGYKRDAMALEIELTQALRGAIDVQREAACTREGTASVACAKAEKSLEIINQDLFYSRLRALDYATTIDEKTKLLDGAQSAINDLQKELDTARELRQASRTELAQKEQIIATLKATRDAAMAKLSAEEQQKIKDAAKKLAEVKPVIPPTAPAKPPRKDLINKKSTTEIGGPATEPKESAAAQVPAQPTSPGPKHLQQLPTRDELKKIVTKEESAEIPFDLPAENEQPEITGEHVPAGVLPAPYEEDTPRTDMQSKTKESAAAAPASVKMTQIDDTTFLSKALPLIEDLRKAIPEPGTGTKFWGKYTETQLKDKLQELYTNAQNALTGEKQADGLFKTDAAAIAAAKSAIESFLLNTQRDSLEEIATRRIKEGPKGHNASQIPGWQQVIELRSQILNIQK